jgi:hypothetical protein
VRVAASARLALAGDLHGALFVLEGSVAITESPGARPRTMRAQDTLLVSPGRQRTLRLRRMGQRAAQVVLLRWCPGLLRQTPVSTHHSGRARTVAAPPGRSRRHP